MGKYRRSDNPHPDATFFDVNNVEGEKARKAAAEAALADMLKWLQNKNNKVAILDATNSTKSRRKWIYDKLTDANVLRKLSLSPSGPRLTSLGRPFCREQV